ncbi:GmrSD restriction endonuclease domain-containing protein [Actinoplanes sp. URMC 104]|uniref:GmrSD restriction endonuclease domain-containing protein n=1 Tax=Actinoplanes sp. URMC 104 TaxID=3423409 RepID=UPI003F1A196C
MEAVRELLARIPVGGRGSKPGYDRSAVFGAPWADVDGNGCDTRDDILRRDLHGVRFLGRCTVAAGLLNDPYTGRAIELSGGGIQIDHVVPLSLAWQLGAASWTQDRRVHFANDPANLLAVDASANMQKRDSGPDSWLPPNKLYRCTYVVRFTRVTSGYGLRLTASMRDAIATQLNGCREIQGDLPATSVLSISPSTAAESYFPNCAAARAAGVAPIRRGQEGYRLGLDRDQDGIACD